MCLYHKQVYLDQQGTKLTDLIETGAFQFHRIVQQRVYAGVNTIVEWRRATLVSSRQNSEYSGKKRKQNYNRKQGVAATQVIAIQFSLYLSLSVIASSLFLFQIFHGKNISANFIHYYNNIGTMNTRRLLLKIIIKCVYKLLLLLTVNGIYKTEDVNTW